MLFYSLVPRPLSEKSRRGLATLPYNNLSQLMNLLNDSIMQAMQLHTPSILTALVCGYVDWLCYQNGDW